MERAEWIRSGRVRTLLELGRVSNVPTVWSNVTAGWLLAGGQWNWRFFVLCVGATLLYVAGMFLNDAFDAAWDQTYRPERPIPSGRIPHRSVWAIGWGLLAVGLAFAGSIFVADEYLPQVWWSLVPLVACIILYDWLHKRSAWSALLMAACRFFLVITAAAAAATGTFFIVGVMYAWWLTIYIFMVTLIARSEAHGGELSAYAKGAIPVLVLMLLVSLHTKQDLTRWWAGVAFAAFFVAWLARGLHIQRTNRSPDRIGRLVVHLLAGIIAFDCIAIATVDLAAVIFVLALLPVTVWLQRFVPAT